MFENPLYFSALICGGLLAGGLPFVVIVKKLLSNVRNLQHVNNKHRATMAHMDNMRSQWDSIEQGYIDAICTLHKLAPMRERSNLLANIYIARALARQQQATQQAAPTPVP